MMFAKLLVDLRRDLTKSEPLISWIEELEISEALETESSSWRIELDESTVWA